MLSKYYPQNTITHGSKLINPTRHSHAQGTAQVVRTLSRVQLYKYNACTLLSHILSIVNSDWLQHVRGVCRVYDSCLTCIHVYLHQAHHTLYPLKIILLDACPCIFTPCTTHHAPIMLLLHKRSHTHFFLNPHTTKKARIFSIDKSIVHEQSTAPCCGLAGVQWPAA